MIDVGSKVGRLTVVAFERYRSHVVCVCACACGNTKKVRIDVLRNGASRSCGCFRRDRASTLRLTHGEAAGGRPSTEWRTWRSMRQRCEDKKCRGYGGYGARGIYVCRRWRKFENFLADMGRRPSSDHSIDRKNNDGPYAPWNCRWATRSEQAKNRRERERLKDGTYAPARRAKS